MASKYGYVCLWCIDSHWVHNGNHCAGGPVRKGIVEILLQLSGGDEKELFLRHPEIITVLVRYLGDQMAVIIHDAYSTLINLTDREDMVELIGVDNMDIVPILINTITKRNSPFADFAAMLLSNLTRSERMARKLLEIGLERQGTNLIKLVEVSINSLVVN